jgi:drug/metabolite transporter (DMT)-like permease
LVGAEAPARRALPARPVSTAGERRTAEAGALLVMVFWAANFIVVKAANREIPPVTFALLRFSLAAAALLIALRIREGSVSLPRRDALLVMGLGAIGFGVYQVIWSTALQSIPAGDSALLIAATPVFTALLAVVAGSDVLTRAKLGGGIVSFVGVAIVVVAGPGLALGLGGGSGSVLLGDALTLGAAGCWSVYTAFGSPILRRYSPLKTSAWAMVGGCGVLLLPGLWEASSASWATVEPTAWLGLLYSALIPAGLSNVVIFHGIRLLGPTRITNYQFLVPFIAVIVGALFLGEGVRPAQIVGGAVIVLGVALTRAGGRIQLGAWLRDRLPS